LPFGVLFKKITLISKSMLHSYSSPSLHHHLCVCHHPHLRSAVICPNLFVTCKFTYNLVHLLLSVPEHVIALTAFLTHTNKNAVVTDSGTLMSKRMFNFHSQNQPKSLPVLTVTTLKPSPSRPQPQEPGGGEERMDAAVQ